MRGNRKGEEMTKKCWEELRNRIRKENVRENGRRTEKNLWRKKIGAEE